MHKAALESGCLAYLAKPFSSAALLSAIDAIAPIAVASAQQSANCQR
jgi:hypothetical protein